MTKHTPGPWKAHKLSQPIGFAEWEIHWSEDGECVAEVVHGEANARLIAAAPEMFEVLSELFEKHPGAIPFRYRELTKAILEKITGQ